MFVYELSPYEKDKKQYEKWARGLGIGQPYKFLKEALFKEIIEKVKAVQPVKQPGKIISANKVKALETFPNKRKLDSLQSFIVIRKTTNDETYLPTMELTTEYYHYRTITQTSNLILIVFNENWRVELEELMAYGV